MRKRGACLGKPLCLAILPPREPLMDSALAGDGMLAPAKAESISASRDAKPMGRNAEKGGG